MAANKFVARLGQLRSYPEAAFLPMKANVGEFDVGAERPPWYEVTTGLSQGQKFSCEL